MPRGKSVVVVRVPIPSLAPTEFNPFAYIDTESTCEYFFGRVLDNTTPFPTALTSIHMGSFSTSALVFGLCRRLSRKCRLWSLGVHGFVTLPLPADPRRRWTVL